MNFSDMHRPYDHTLRGAVKWIVGITTVMFVLQLFLGRWMVPYLALVPEYVLKKYFFWQPFTYLFLHGGVFHWLFNMLIVWMFGREIEARWGTPRFLFYYFLTGTFGAFVSLFLFHDSVIPILGASGAVFGLLVAFAVMFPNSVMYLYFLIPLKAWHACLLFGIIELATVMNSSGHVGGAIVHLSGMLAGYVYLKWGSLFQLPTSIKKRIHSVIDRLKFKKPVEFVVVTDELTHQVDRILDKVLKKGAKSLSAEEKEIMERYTKLKNR